MQALSQIFGGVSNGGVAKCDRGAVKGLDKKFFRGGTPHVQLWVLSKSKKPVFNRFFSFQPMLSYFRIVIFDQYEEGLHTIYYCTHGEQHLQFSYKLSKGFLLFRREYRSKLRELNDEP
jgi:hypothetical protein